MNALDTLIREAYAATDDRYAAADRVAVRLGVTRAEVLRYITSREGTTSSAGAWW